MDGLRRMATVGTVGAAGVILLGTLTPLLTSAGEGCVLGLPCTLGHAMAFGALGVSLAGLFATSKFARRAPQRALVMLILGLWIFAAVTELAQGSVGRDPSLEDWVADMAGAIGGLLAGGLALRMLVGSRLAVAVAGPVTGQARGAGGGRRKARR